ncbi:MAG: hydrogenase 4 subunit B, partial [Cyanobacteria bacterium HKST-UBA03]|nr:hydrogenase 4 subunit B [Cyanobacteria bacterium HKST-UBA03]
MFLLSYLFSCTNPLFAAFLILAAGSIFTFLASGLSKHLSIYLSALSILLAACLALFTGFTALASPGQTAAFTLAQLPLQGSLSFACDGMSAFFLLLIAAACIPISLYAIGYMQAEYMGRHVGVIGAVCQLFILSMMAVVTSTNGLGFLLAWESMALTSFLLVITNTESQEALQAGFIYLLMTHGGTACLIVLFLLLGNHANSLDFAAFAHAGPLLQTGLKSLLFALAFVGFGAKAGLIPMHTWLPQAHPTAPSHVSALMSGVMLKTAVYGFLRVILDFLAPFPSWWGLLVMGVAMITAFFGILYAAQDSDIKRLLAYSSIENLGIIFLAIGAGMVFLSLGHPGLGLVCLLAALLHSLNHALFKSLLFMGAGAILSVCHTRWLNNLGGLIRVMPQTAWLFLTGALAIAALPPLNGFLSEWLLFQGLLASRQLHDGTLTVFMVLAAALLGMIGAIAAYTFLKAFAIAFLAMPRSRHAEHAQEVGFLMRLGMGLLAIGTVIVGVFPFLTLPRLNQMLLTHLHLTGSLDNPLAVHTTVWGVTLGPTTGYSPGLLCLVFV